VTNFCVVGGASCNLHANVRVVADFGGCSDAHRKGLGGTKARAEQAREERRLGARAADHRHRPPERPHSSSIATAFFL
jgi:hypothetical protein